jgi:hypothetical protein
MPKACRAEILIAHGVSRGLRTNEKKPGAQGAFMNEAAFASGMKTDALIATTITSLRRLSYIHEQSHAIISTNGFKFLSRPYITCGKFEESPQTNSASQSCVRCFHVISFPNCVTLLAYTYIIFVQ